MSQFFSGTMDPAWPHFWLIGGSIIGGALVGLGVILEAPKIFSVPVAAVFVGVVLEAACTLLLFGFDEGITAKQRSDLGAQQSVIRAQNDRIIALDEKLAPRVLGGDQETALTWAAMPFAPQQYTVSAAVGSEPAALLCQIDTALIKAGWVRHAPTDLIHTKPCGDWEAGVNITSEIRVRVAVNAPEPIQNAAVAIWRALQADGIATHPEKDTAITDTTIVEILVGAKL